MSSLFSAFPYGKGIPVATSAKERGAAGGRARAERLSPERRREIASLGHLAGSVKAVVDRAPELTLEQIEQLRAALDGMTR